MEIADFVGAHLDRIEQFVIPNDRTDNPNDTITIELLIGTVVPAVAHGVVTSDPGGLAEHDFSPILLR